MSEDLKAPGTGWKWYTAAAPNIGWDCAFMAPDDLLENFMKYEKVIPCRAMGKLRIGKDGKGNPVLELDRNLPGMFKAQVLESAGVVSRNTFIWIFEAAAEAAAEWTRVWTEDTVSAFLLEGTEADAEVLAAQARQKATLARAIRSPKA